MRFLHDLKIKLNTSTLQRIWHDHGLSNVHSVSRPSRGAVNQVLIVNGLYVIRLDSLELDEKARYYGEKLAYDTLRGVVPVPEVIAVDESKQIVPQEYIITTKVAGTPVIDSWQTLAETQRQHIAYTAGAYLAAIHEQTFSRFGKLSLLPDGGFDTWFDEVQWFASMCAENAFETQALDAHLIGQIDDLIPARKPLLDQITTPCLVHADYQFENLLQQDGTITGILDFEWSKADDPAWDFKLDEQWEEECPGSRDAIYAGYIAHRPLDEHHHERVLLYKLLLYYDDVSLCKADPKWGDYDVALKRVMTTLEAIST